MPEHAGIARERGLPQPVAQDDGAIVGVDEGAHLDAPSSLRTPRARA